MGSLHARVIAGHDRTRLVAVVDPDERVGRPTADRYGARWVRDLDDVPDVDAVVVAAGNGAHREIGARVLDRGLPLLMEKPLADSLADAEDLVRQSGRLGVPLMCGLLERYNPGVLTAMTLLEEPLHIVTQRHSPYVPRIRSGVAADLLIHDADLAVRLMGAEPVRVQGSLGHLHPDSDPASEDVAETLLAFGTGAVANLSASRMSQRKVRSLVVSELNRLVEVDLLRNAVTLYQHVHGDQTGDGTSYKAQTIVEIPQLVTSREPLAAQLDRFVALATGDGRRRGGAGRHPAQPPGGRGGPGRRPGCDRLTRAPRTRLSGRPSGPGPPGAGAAPRRSRTARRTSCCPAAPTRARRPGQPSRSARPVPSAAGSASGTSTRSRPLTRWTPGKLSGRTAATTGTPAAMLSRLAVPRP